MMVTQLILFQEIYQNNMINIITQVHRHRHQRYQHYINRSMSVKYFCVHKTVMQDISTQVQIKERWAEQTA